MIKPRTNDSETLRVEPSELFAHALPVILRKGAGSSSPSTDRGCGWNIGCACFVCFRSSPGDSSVQQSLASPDAEGNEEHSLGGKTHVTDHSWLRDTLWRTLNVLRPWLTLQIRYFVFCLVWKEHKLSRDKGHTFWFLCLSLYFVYRMGHKAISDYSEWEQLWVKPWETRSPRKSPGKW